jgi:hypothetical protein
MAEFLVNSL